MSESEIIGDHSAEFYDRQVKNTIDDLTTEVIDDVGAIAFKGYFTIVDPETIKDKLPKKLLLVVVKNPRISGGIRKRAIMAAYEMFPEMPVNLEVQFVSENNKLALDNEELWRGLAEA